jgi:hypothetical protein
MTPDALLPLWQYFRSDVQTQPKGIGNQGPTADVVARWFVSRQHRGQDMQRFNDSAERGPRRVRESRTYPAAYGRALANRRYGNLGRQPRSTAMPLVRPPYLEVAVTGGVFLFLIFVVVGGM